MCSRFYLIKIVSLTLNISIDREIGTPGNSKDVVYGLNAIDKRYMRQKIRYQIISPQLVKDLVWFIMNPMCKLLVLQNNKKTFQQKLLVVPSTDFQAFIHSRLSARACPPWRHVHDYMARAYRAPLISTYMARAYCASFISTYRLRPYRVSVISMTPHILE